MRYIVDINQNQVDEIQKLIEKGRFNNFSQFIQTAIENQVYIENNQIQEFKTALPTKNIFIKEVHHDRNGFLEDDIKIILKTEGNNPKTVPMPKYSQLGCFSEKVSENKCWLWGQVNRIFPIKLGLRVLLALIGSDEWIDLEEFRERAAGVACAYGKKLGNAELGHKRREDKISTGLPLPWMDIYKSKMRYKSHFLAYMRKDEKLEGAMSFLKFVNLTKNEKGKVLIGITEPGLLFSKLENPVIEHNSLEFSLSDKEINFYIEHVYKSVKGEFFAINWLLNKLKTGITTRKRINKEINKEFGELWESSEAVINTQRSGLMARLFEIGLIDKEKDGIKVNYSVSKNGINFLNKFKTE